MEKMQKGFTLIEMMIVVLMIGILAAVAIPHYQEYVVRSKLGKVASYAVPIKFAIASYSQEYGALPPVGVTWASLGIFVPPPQTSEVSSITVSAVNPGEIIMTLSNIKAGTIDGQTITLIPSLGQTTIYWSASSSSSDSNLVHVISQWQ